MTELIDMSVFDAELSKCYLTSKSELVRINNQDENIDDHDLYMTVHEKVRDRFQYGIYISFKGYDHIYYYDCSNNDIPKTEFPGILVLPGIDGYCHYQFEECSKVSVVLSAGENKYEFTIESSGLYRVEEKVVSKIDDFNVDDELVQFQLEMCRIHLSPLLFNGEDYHTNEEILRKLMENRQLNKVYLTDFVQKDKVSSSSNNDNNVDAIINNHDTESTSETIQESKLTRSITKSTTIVRTTEINITHSTTTVTSSNNVVELNDKCNCYDYCTEDCKCLSNCNNNCDTCRKSINDSQIIDEEDRIIIYTNYTNVHLWDCGINTVWPGQETKVVEGNNYREIVVEGNHCCLIGSNSGSDSTPEFSIEKAGRYYLTKQELSTDENIMHQ